MLSEKWAAFSTAWFSTGKCFHSKVFFVVAFVNTGNAKKRVNGELWMINSGVLVPEALGGCAIHAAVHKRQDLVASMLFNRQPV